MHTILHFELLCILCFDGNSSNKLFLSDRRLFITKNCHCVTSRMNGKKEENIANYDIFIKVY